MNITIEKACPEDVAFVKQLEVDCGLGSWSKDDYLQEISNGNIFFLVAKQKDNSRLGFILARLITIYHNSLTAFEVEIYNIAVKKEFRRARIATELIEKLLEIGNQHKVRKIYLEVRETNYKALEFYNKNSFIIIGKRTNFYTDPTENAILMCRSLLKEETL